MAAVDLQRPLTNGHGLTNGHAHGEDVEMNGTDGSAAANGDAGAASGSSGPRFATGLILPPPDIKCEC